MTWEGVHAGRPWGSWPTEEAVRFVSARSGGRSLDVLDLGTGGGANLRLLREDGHRAVGIDIAASALRRLTEATWAAEALLVRGDAVRLPFVETFDLVLEVESLCYLSPSEQALAWEELARVLRPGGEVLSIAFTDRCYPVQPGSQPQTPADGPLSGAGPTTFLDEPALLQLVQGAGLEVTDLQKRSRTVGPQRLLIEEWVVAASKAGR